MEVSDGDVAGLKSATIRVSGEYAFGWLRTETGIHRLVRKSPFDSNTVAIHHLQRLSFILKLMTILILKSIQQIYVLTFIVHLVRVVSMSIKPKVRCVLLTCQVGIVVQCQNDRSQHKNKDQAMKQLKAKLYELELQKKNADKQAMEDNKSDIGWGSQIRSYVLDDSRIKDLRTGIENRNTQAVLDGDLDKFIEASLKAGL